MPEISLIILNLFCLAAIGFYIYLLIFLSEVEINKNRLIFKTVFRSKKIYTFDKLEIPSSFRIKRTKFITVRMKNRDGFTDKFVILNNIDVDTEDVLWSLMQK